MFDIFLVHPNSERASHKNLVKRLSGHYVFGCNSVVSTQMGVHNTMGATVLCHSRGHFSLF